jgi:hypothetical protein
MRPIGNHGLYRANARHSLNARGVWGCVPVGRPPLASTMRAKRSGASVAIRSPISEPQSWQNSVMSRRSIASSHAFIHATWFAYE